MTPKEKAIKLVHKFYNEIPLLDGCSWCNVNYKCENRCEKKCKSAKQCALMAVDEILDVLCMDINPIANYWFEVKQEIDEL
jgi:hypothetical protein